MIVGVQADAIFHSTFLDKLGIQNVERITPLEVAIALKHFEVADILLESGLNVTASSNLSLSLRLAAKNGNRALCERLITLPEVSANAKQPNSLSAVEIACKEANKNLLDFLRSVGGIVTLECLGLSAESLDDGFFYYVLHLLHDTKMLGPQLPFKTRQSLLRRIAFSGSKEMLTSILETSDFSRALVPSDPAFHGPGKLQDVFAPILIELLHLGRSSTAISILQNRSAPKDNSGTNDFSVYKAAIFTSKLDVAEAIRSEDRDTEYRLLSKELFFSLSSDTSESVLSYLLRDLEVPPNESQVLGLIEESKWTAFYLLVTRFNHGILTENIVAIVLNRDPMKSASFPSITNFDPCLGENAALLDAYFSGHDEVLAELMKSERAVRAAEDLKLLERALDEQDAPMAVVLIQSASPKKLFNLLDQMIDDLTSKFKIKMAVAMVRTGRVDAKAQESHLFRKSVQVGNVKLAKELAPLSATEATDSEILDFVKDSGKKELFDFVLGLPTLDVNRKGFLRAVRRRGFEFMEKVMKHPSYRGLEESMSGKRYSLKPSGRDN